MSDMTHRGTSTGNGSDHPEQIPEQREEHSLPGTNQAGKGPGESEEEDVERGRLGTTEETTRPADAPPEGQVERHSLPGTNQAGRLREEPPA